MPNPFLKSSIDIKDASKNPFNKLNAQPVAKAQEPAKTVFNSNPFTTAPVSGAVPVAEPLKMVDPIQNTKNLFATQGVSSKDNPTMSEGYKIFGASLPTSTSIKPVVVEPLKKSSNNPFDNFQIDLPNINTGIANSTPSIDLDAPTVMQNIFGAIRATSDIATLPFTIPVAAIDKNITVKDIIDTTIEMARNDMKTGGEASMDQAVQQYAQWQKIGKYGSGEVRPIDIAVFAGLGFFHIFGDPVLGVAELAGVAKAAKFAAEFKQAGRVTKTLEEGSKFTQTGKATLDLNKDLKLVINKSSKDVTFTGYIRRGSQGEILNSPLEIENIVKETSKSTGMSIVPEVRGNDLILKQGGLLTKDTALPVARDLQFSGQDLITTGRPVEAPVQSLDFGGITPVVQETAPVIKDAIPEITQIRDLAVNNGFRDVVISDKPITDNINNQAAPSGVDLINRTIKISTPELQKDLANLSKGIELPNGVITHDANEYITSLVNFEKQHLANATIEDIQNLRSGDEALIKKTLANLDERAIKSYTAEFPPTPEQVKAMDARTTAKEVATVAKDELPYKGLNITKNASMQEILRAYDQATPNEPISDLLNKIYTSGKIKTRAEAQAVIKEIDDQVGSGGFFVDRLGDYEKTDPEYKRLTAVISEVKKFQTKLKASLETPKEATYKVGQSVKFNKKDWTIGSVTKIGKEDKYMLQRAGKTDIWTNQLGLDNENISQTAKVSEAIKDEPKTIKQVAEETKIKEPNIRRILGVGAKEGKFTRVDKGVYTLSKDGVDTAWIETSNAVESLPRLAGEGFKADMVFLDIPYDTPAVRGGNRGVKYDLLSVDDFSTVLDAVKTIARGDNSPVIHMFSQAESGLKAMAKYNDLFITKGFKPVGRGEYQKTFADGSPVTSPNGKVSKPEGILVFTKSGKLDKALKDLNFTLRRPKGYQTEKPAEMLEAMIKMTTNEGDIILDPFAGSGVTGAEAIKAGRKPYLIERNPDVAENVTKPRVQTEFDKKMSNEIENEFASAAPGSINKTSQFLKENRNVSDVKTVEDFVISTRAKQVLTDLGIKSAEKLQGPRNLGVYKTLPNKARFQSLYDVTTVAHEGAHGVDINNVLVDKAIADKSDILPSLRRSYLEYYPGASQSKRVIIQLREGFAEFIENYFTNPVDVAAKYPKLIDAFIKPDGAYYHPQTTQLLDGMNSLVEDFQRMTPEQRIGAKMRSGDELVKEDKGFTAKQKIVFETLNYLEPFVRYVKETGTNPLSFANPQLANYNWMNRNSIAASWISSPTHSNLIVDSKNGGRLIRRDSGTVKDYLHLIKGKEKEFDQFLIARRVVADNSKLISVQNKLTIAQNLMADIKNATEGVELDVKQKNKLVHLKALINQLEEQRDLFKNIIEKDDFNVNDARSVVAKYTEEFKDATKIHDNIWRNLLEFSYRNDMITAENYGKWSTEPGYASFKRFVDDDLALNANNGSSSSNFIAVSVFKNRGGSALDLFSPVNSQIRAIFEIIPKALENTMWVKTYELTNKTGNKELASRFEAVTPNDPRSATNDPKLITVKIDGKARFFRPANEFAEIRRVMSDKEIDTLAQLALIPTRLFTRATTSANPYFLLGNVSIDQFSRAYNTEHGTGLVDVGKAFGKFIVNSAEDNIQNYKALGGYHQTFAGAHDIRDLSPNELTKKIRNEAKTKTQKVVNALEVALEVIETPSKISEMGTRYAEFEKAIKEGMTETEAMWAAANVSVNFGQHGAAFGPLGRFLVKAAPFLNPAIQGTYLFGQKVAAHPGRAASLTAQIAVASLAATIVTMEAMDDDMKRKLSNISTTELSKYIFIPMPKMIRDKTGVDFAKLKIPEVVGSTIGMAQLFVISNYSGNEATFKEYLNVATSWIPNQLNVIEPAKAFVSWFPQIVKPTIQAIGNFRDYPDVMPILSDTMKNKPLALQYNANTSKLAKSVGPILGISPIILDYWIKAQFGAAGKYATQGVGLPSTLMNSDQYLTVGRVYQKFFDQKLAANDTKQTVEASSSASKEEVYTATRNNLMYNHIGNTVADISDVTKDKLELPETIKSDMNSLLVGVTNKETDVIATYDQLAKVNKEIMKFRIDNTPNMSTDEKLKLLKENMSTERSAMISSYEEAYRKYNPTVKPSIELDPATQKLLSDIKKKIMNAGGSDADITTVKEKVKLETDANAEYKAKRKALENLPEQVKKQNPEIYQQAKEEKNALRTQ